ncbi:MAG TPA: diacylglycerol kinase family protein [Candidatus Limnocylindrales bacterium]|nr:diacylglycerol kinase family protein [Candidatus Limnocylindrales bacterium]
MTAATPGPVADVPEVPEGSGPTAHPRPWVILNATAGKKAGIATNEATNPEEIEALFTALGTDVIVHATTSEEDAIATTLDGVAAGCPAIVAAGGDGTFGLVARTILSAAAPGSGDALPAVGALPLGSAMNVARSLGIPRDLPAAAAIIADGHTRPIDVGELPDGQVFFEAIAIGLHAELFAEAAAFDDGDWAAPLRAAWTAVRYTPSRLTLHLDEGKISTRALIVSVSNGPYTGLGFTVAPDARLDDGRFDIRLFEGFSRLELLRHFGSIALGRRRYEPKVRTYRSRSVRVESVTPLRVGVDGEDAGETPVEATVRPAALRVLVPRP